LVENVSAPHHAMLMFVRGGTRADSQFGREQRRFLDGQRSRALSKIIPRCLLNP